MVDKIREVILKTLYEIDYKGAYSNIALDKQLKQAKKEKIEIEKRDIGFISEIVYGTVSWKLTIDEILKKYSKIQIKKISPWILNILRMSIYQIVFLDKVPKSAAVNEGVNLAKRYGHQASSNFVNAILRKVSKKDYEEFLEIKDPIERISKTASMPIWIIEKLLEQEKLNKVEEICKNSNIKPKLYIRINPLKTNQQNLEERLEEEMISYEETDLENFLEVKDIRNIEKLKSFQQGLYTIQDKQAGEVARVLDPKPGETVLDACSSPGGKTTYLAELMKNKGSILAWDLYDHRVKLVKDAYTRLGITIIQEEVKDASRYEEKYEETFDKILLDVPCLGLGVLKRKPDIKWQRKPEDIKEIAKTQEAILETCSRYLKQGGKLVYSTCSILKEENEKIIEKFVEKSKNFVIEEQISTFQNENTDGFFICKMKKID